MKSDWLKKQLIPVKEKSLLYRELAEVIQSVVKQAVEPYLERLKNRPSLFNMSREDLITVIRELGDFFRVKESNYSDNGDLAIIVMQRQDEIHQKRTVYPLLNTINREFPDINMQWEPLYAPVDQEKNPYGKYFVRSKDVAKRKNNDVYFLTSRGVLTVPILEVLNNYSHLDSYSAVKELSEQVERLIYPIIPLRIVKHGLMMTMEQKTQIHTAPVIKIIHYVKIGPKMMRPIFDETARTNAIIHSREVIEITINE